MGKFTKVSVPKIITDQIDKLLKNKNILYTTRASFIEDGMKVMKKVKGEDGSWEPTEIDKDRGVVIYTTTATGSSEEEEDNRFISITVESDKEIWTEVNTDQLFRTGDEKTIIEKIIADSRDSWLKIGMEKLEFFDDVVIPYATMIKIRSESARTQRDLKRFLNFIKALAWINQNNRYKKTVKVNEEKEIKLLYADPSDLYWATWLSEKAFNQSISGIDPRTSVVWFAVRDLISEGNYELIEDAPDYYWVKRPVLQKRVGIKKGDTIKEHVKTLEDLGLLATHTARGGSRVFVTVENPLSGTDISLFKHSIIDQYAIVKAHYDALTPQSTTHRPPNRPPDGKIDHPIDKVGQMVGQSVGSLPPSFDDDTIYNNINNNEEYKSTHHHFSHMSNKGKNKKNNGHKENEKILENKKDDKDKKNNSPIHILGERGGGQIKTLSIATGKEKKSLHDKILEVKDYVEKVIASGHKGVSSTALYDNFEISIIDGLMQSGQLLKLPGTDLYTWSSGK